MGTYRQPSQIIDKSLNTLNQGLQNVQQTMTAELNRRREIELKKAEEAEKKFKAFESSRDTKVDKYKYAMSDWKTINQGKDPNWESEDVSVENQLKNNALYYLDIMSGSVEGDERYRNAELSIKNMIRDYPVMAELLNSEAQEYSKTLENPNLLIETDDPLAKTKQGMLGDVFQGKNPYKFNVQTGPQGMSIKYRGEDGSDFNLRAQDYEKHVSNGYNLIDTTNNDAYNEFMEGVGGVVFQNYNDNVTEQETSTFKDDLKTGKRTTTTEVIENFERANASVKKQINAFVDKGPNITQNEWQLLGGKGVYRGKGTIEDKESQKGQLANLLYEQQIAMNGVPDSDLNVLRKRSTKESGLSSTDSSSKNVLTLSTKEQVSTLGDEYVETRDEIKGAINDVVLMAPILTKYSSDDTSYLTYDDIVEKVNKETGSGQPFETKEEADEFLGKLDTSSIYAEEKGKINVKNPISVLDSNFNELLNTVMKGRYKGITPAALSIFKDKYKDVEKNEIKTQAELDKAYADLAPGDSITVNGKTYTKPKK